MPLHGFIFWKCITSYEHFPFALGKAQREWAQSQSRLTRRASTLYDVSSMKDLAHNNLVRFKNISKKKEGIYANFKVKGVRNGTTFSASIVVDIDAAEVHAGDPLEKIIEECARIGVEEFQKSEFQFEGLTSI